MKFLNKHIGVTQWLGGKLKSANAYEVKARFSQCSDQGVSDKGKHAGELRA